MLKHILVALSDMEYSILFSGHMIDAPDRTSPRFPPDKEAIVRSIMKAHLMEEKIRWNGVLKGIASGACGGDILFHELCIELGIHSEIYLPLPAAEFKKGSVSFAGRNWDQRFEHLVHQLPVHLLPAANSALNIYERVNIWMLDIALKNGAENMMLMTVWNKQQGDGNGGTAHMVDVTEKKGGIVKIITPTFLL